MAKKTIKTEKTNEPSIREGYIQHATKRCKESDCMGNPKETKLAETFDGSICTKCWAVHEFKKQEVVEDQTKLEIAEKAAEEKADKKAKKIKDKTIEASEEEIEKLIKKAEKPEKKKTKKIDGHQQSMF